MNALIVHLLGTHIGDQETASSSIYPCILTLTSATEEQLRPNNGEIVIFGITTCVRPPFISAVGVSNYVKVNNKKNPSSSVSPFTLTL